MTTRDYRVRRVCVLTRDQAHYGAGRTATNRAPVDLTDMPRLLDGALAAITEPAGVLMLSGVRLADLTLPAADGPWIYGGIGAWGSYTHRQTGRVVHVGLLDEIDYRRSPLFHPADEPASVADALDAWHAHTGTPWTMTAGIVGTNALRAAHSRSGQGAQPRWVWTLPRGLRGVGPQVWGDPFDTPETHGYVHQFDCNAQYLAALRNVDLPWGPLEHTGAAPYDTDQAGLWLIDMIGLPAELTAGKGRPPVIPARLVHNGEAWVSAPVMKYLCQAGYRPEIIDAWTADNTHPIGRSYAERLSAVRMGMTGDAPDVVRRAVKSVYVEMVGILGREGGRVYRRDWQITIMDLARVNLQRRLDRAADLTSHWPFMVRTDAAYYWTAEPDAGERIGAALGLGTGAGKMRHIGTWTVDAWRAEVERARRQRVHAANAGRNAGAVLVSK